MKKFFMYAVAVAATMSLTSCLSEDELNLEKGNMGTISVNINADNSLTTRAKVETVTDWFAFIDGEGTDHDFGTAASHQQMTTLAATKFPYGSYSVTVSNYENMTEAHKVNSNFGAAYYEGSPETNPITVSAGGNTEVTIDCGKAKNVKFNVQTSGFDGSDAVDGGLYFVNVTITSNNTETDRITGEEESNFDALTTSSNAYFQAGTTLGYTVNWKYNGNARNATGTITLAGAGTQNYVSIVSNADGTISISNTTGITYDDGWTDGTTSTVTVSAETGNKLD